MEGFKPGLIAHLRGVIAGMRLDEEGREYIRQALESPSRRVRSTARSASGRYPSMKMGATISFESRTLEYPAAMTLEHDGFVVAYVEQAPPLNVRYQRGGRTRSYQQRPDFLAIYNDRVVLIECKPLVQIAKRNEADSGFYVREGDEWVCPPLQEATRRLGLQHVVWTEESFSAVRLRNLRMLEDYLTSHTELAGYAGAYEALAQHLTAKARANIEELLKDLSDRVCVDHLYAVIARGDVAFDYDAAPLAEPHRCWVYRDQRTMEAFALSEQSKVLAPHRIVSAVVEVGSGTSIEWDGALWRCIHIGAQQVMLARGEQRETLPRPVFDDLVRVGVIRSAASQAADTRDAEIYERISKASETELRMANERHKRIVRYLAPGAPSPASRTERRHLAQYRHAQMAHGNGFVGLIPGFGRSGNRTPRLLQDVLDIVARNVKQHYLDAANKDAKAVHVLIGDACKVAHLPVPSYAWFCRFLKRLPAYETLLARAGAKGAYAIEPRNSPQEGLDKTSPDRCFERAHIDHTLIDVETIFSETSEPLGRCWLTLMIDHHSRRVLAVHLTYDPPSYRSVLMVLRKCVQRFGRLPDQIVVDGGKEFQSVWFDTTCALYRVAIIRRPIAKARYGSQCERLFGTCNTNLLHFLSGNTQLRKNVRQMTDAVDPNRFAIWTLPELHAALERYFYEVYDTLEHRELLVTPRFAFERSIERHGNRPDRIVIDNELFQITTSPAPAKGTAKVQPDGVKIHYLYYSHPSLQRHLGKSVPVRYDPFDLSKAWALVGRAWQPLKSRHTQLLRGFTEHEMDLMTAEWRKRRSAVEKTRLSEPVLVKFLQEVLQTETLLLERKRAAAERYLREAQADAVIDVPIEQDGSAETATSTAEPAPIDAFALAINDIELLETM